MVSWGLVERTDRVRSSAAVSAIALTVVGVATAVSVFAPGYGSRYGGAAVAVVGVLLLVAGRRFDRTDVVAVAFVAWAAASQFWTVSPPVSWELFKDLAGAVVLFVGVRLAVRTPRHAAVLAAAYLAGCVWVAFNLGRQELGPGARATMDGTNANYLAYALTVGVALVLYLWHAERPALWGRLGCVVLAVAIFAFGILPTGTRAVLVSLAGLALWMVLWRVFRLRTLRLPMAALVVTVVTVASGVLDDPIRSRLSITTRETGTLNGRLDAWPFARDVFFDNPVVGVGLDAFMTLNMGIAAHNALLDVASGLGVVGLVIFCVWFWRALIVDSAPADAAARALVVGGFLVVMTPILASGFWHEAPAFWVAVALMSRAGVVFPSAPDADAPVADDRVDRRT